jgi:hypothetical protein
VWFTHDTSTDSLKLNRIDLGHVVNSASAHVTSKELKEKLKEVVFEEFIKKNESCKKTKWPLISGDLISINGLTPELRL